MAKDGQTAGTASMSEVAGMDAERWKQYVRLQALQFAEISGRFGGKDQSLVLTDAENFVDFILMGRKPKAKAAE